MNREGRRIEVRGIVQGVGFRPWIWRLARENGIQGRVSNDSRGVTIEAFGEEPALDALLAGMRSGPPPAAEIRDLTWRRIPPEPVSSFTIVESRRSEELVVSIPPDRATCDDCLAEVFDPRDRRYRYAFTNCTNCGPRFTIVREVPYDRPGTTMAPFRMCDACRQEYDDPADRRFHAQPNACPACGPTLTAVAPDGSPLEWTDPIGGAARLLREGGILALKGLGGFHLSCDATSPEAVRELRRRKRREEKPLAVMVRSIAEAEQLALIGPAERAILTSSERPILLLPRRADSPLASEVAPDNPLVGLMLPYTPLHHLLLAEADRPLVMTSGNLSEEPIACGNEEALRRLGGVADAFLLHEREIESRCDDSVVAMVAAEPVLLRRSRGYVPRPVLLDFRFPEPVLACGAHLKNTFCVGMGELAYLGPHIGDLENLETLQAFEQAIARWERFLRVTPRVVAHDFHPGYVSTFYARSRPGATLVPVQHHHAHVAAAMAEHALEGPVYGFAWDGTGWGPDGTAWGGELLRADYGHYERIGSFRALPLAGGETAIREVWRLALALCRSAFPGGAPLERLPLFSKVPRESLRGVTRMIESGIAMPRARGVGRYFDAFGALLLGVPVSRYEGQVAMRWNLIADGGDHGAYPFDLDSSAGPPEVDLTAAARAAVEDFLEGVAIPVISARFHETLARAAAAMLPQSRSERGRLPVVLTGGCFQNSLLTRRVLERLPGWTVFRHRRVPPGDGGLALGQAAVAAAILRKGGI
jgi:hydrogenase maturation protein HypF